MRRDFLKKCVLLLVLVAPQVHAQSGPEPQPTRDGQDRGTARVYEGTEFPTDQQVDAKTAQEMAAATERSAPVVVVSGGISLGAYQAGFIATLVRFWSVARERGGGANLGDPTPRVWTGASAGAVNALLGGLASCDPAFGQPQWTPEKSLFWKVWVGQLDLHALLPLKDNDRGNHLFSEAHMRNTLKMIEWSAAQTEFRPNCSFAFGITVTNLSGRQIPFGWGGPSSRGELTRVTEKFVAQVLTDSKGKLKARLPFIEKATRASFPYISVKQDEFPYYPALEKEPENEGGQSISLSSLLRIPQASGAFPLAFQPVSLQASFFSDERWSRPQTLRLVDGGFLNNNPLDLAVRLASHWIEQPSTQVNCDDDKQNKNPDGLTMLDRCRFPIVYLDQDIVDWKWKSPGVRHEASRSPLVETYLKHIGNLVAAAQDSVVLETLEHDSRLSGRIKIPQRSFVLPSEFRFAMFGFFDRRFREHDFYRGMQDAIHFLATQLNTTRTVQSLVPRKEDEMIKEREQRIEDALDFSSKGFACISKKQCARADDALAQLSRATDELTQVAIDNQLEQDDLNQLLASLGKSGYHYSSGAMGGAKATGTREDLLPVRDRIGMAFLQLVDNQTGGLKVGLRPAGSAFLDEWLTYKPPKYALTIQLSRQRGLGFGAEAPFNGSEERGINVYDRRELRLGVAMSALGIRDMDQIRPGARRWRWVSLGAYLDWVSDFDGISGRFSFLDLGPYVRWRAGLGFTGSYLSSPQEVAFQLPEARLGFEIAEMLGIRLTIPLLLLKKEAGKSVQVGTPRYYQESSVGVEAIFTYW